MSHVPAPSSSPTSPTSPTAAGGFGVARLADEVGRTSALGGPSLPGSAPAADATGSSYDAERVGVAGEVGRTSAPGCPSLPGAVVAADGAGVGGEVGGASRVGRAAPERRPAGVEDELPAEAFAAALAGLPGMGPARLASVLAARAPAEAWVRIRRGQPWTEPDVRAALGPGARTVLAAWRTAALAADVSALWRRLVDSPVGVTLHGTAAYPAVLADDIEPPAVLFHLGELAALARPGPRVAIVGTRRCTALGAGIAYELGHDLATNEIAIVSGLAWGIDGAAHRGALAAETAPPIGVVGSGLDVVYPAGQQRLWDAVAAAGVLLSEAPLGARPERWRFPARNRIIAALADVVVVVESHQRGGSFHTVDEADRRGIDVMAVPGSIRNSAARGVNDLLAEGRAPVRDVDDVLIALGLTAATRRPGQVDRRTPPLNDDRPVLEAVGWQASSLDQIAVRTGRALPDLAGALDRLCAARWVRQDGGWYERISAGSG